jgi:hypothetical protein
MAGRYQSFRLFCGSSQILRHGSVRFALSSVGGLLVFLAEDGGFRVNEKTLGQDRRYELE